MANAQSAGTGSVKALKNQSQIVPKIAAAYVGTACVTARRMCVIARVIVAPKLCAETGHVTVPKMPRKVNRRRAAAKTAVQLAVMGLVTAVKTRVPAPTIARKRSAETVYVDVRKHAEIAH